MGPRLALWVLLYLPRALQGQSPHTRAAPSSVLQSFEDSKFQGEWYVLGLAGNTHTVADRSLLSPFTATFVLNKNNHLEAAYAMIRDKTVAYTDVLFRSEFQNRRNIQAGLAMVSDRLFLSPAFPWTRCCAVQGDRHSGASAVSPGRTSLFRSPSLGRSRWITVESPGRTPRRSKCMTRTTCPSPSCSPKSSRTCRGSSGSACCAEYGLFRPRCWTSSSAWSELRASRMTVSSFQT
ncbi:epididymal-specific lipocalin-12 isoform X1 [Bos javanicus]|uniref:epididymal-specific lipocalin-12 isoform X1 n=1 Tax=Bos javanicus TaxID=9906 RepID=UPI002AA7F46D|nr:epididymal-specific lipocalin-12 isoform X1 [Bos javanicus]